MKFIGGSWYLGDYLGPREELGAWMQPQVEAWSHEVRVLGKIVKRHPHLDCSGLGVLLQLKWKCLQRTVPRFGTFVGSMEESLRDTFFSALLGGGGG